MLNVSVKRLNVEHFKLLAEKITVYAKVCLRSVRTFCVFFQKASLTVDITQYEYRFTITNTCQYIEAFTSTCSSSYVYLYQNGSYLNGSDISFTMNKLEIRLKLHSL